MRSDSTVGWALVACLVAALALQGCKTGSKCFPEKTPPAPVASETGAIYFASPREAVPAANQMLAASDWRRLARCYDLSVTRTPEDDLVSGRFFATGVATSSGAQPVLSSRQPFPAGSEFLDAQPLGDEASLPCIWMLRTALPIDQGGGMIQRVTSDCHMIQTKEGFRFLTPAQVENGRKPGAEDGNGAR
ncbi:MAG: hypothetical protein HYZ53_10695 [Planctomycetes bacterium]|nr:hypothetical protein [Planctomycetota bacterium]